GGRKSRRIPRFMADRAAVERWKQTFALLRRRFPGAEDPAAAATRGAAALHRIAAAHDGGRVLVVAHNTLLRLVLCRLLSLPLAEYRRVFPQLRNAAVSEIRMDEGVTALLSLNVPCEQATW
ncbi:histidine phosphatase family protein, partial [Streptomyces sp. NPDC001617]